MNDIKYIGDLTALKITNKETWLKYANKQYNYKKNLEHLKERYLNKISWLEKHLNEKNQDNNMGMIYGLLIAIHDIEDMLDKLEV